MIDLKPFVGRHVILVLSAGNAWLATHVEKGQAELVIADRGDGHAGFVPSPFLRGTVVEMTVGCYAVATKDETGKKLEIAVNPALIATVTAAVEERLVALSS